MRWLRNAVPEVDPRTGLDPITICTIDLEMNGSVAPTGQRVTDMLLRGHDLAFLPDGAAVSPENWISVSPADILLAIPTPLPDPSPWQEERQLHRVLVRLPGYELIGTVHLEPGWEEGAQLKGRRTFLPITSAEIRRRGTSQPDERDVVIVNLARSMESRVTA